MKKLFLLSLIVGSCAGAAQETQTRFCPRGFKQISETRCIRYRDVGDGYWATLLERDPQTGRLRRVSDWCRYIGGYVTC